MRISVLDWASQRHGTRLCRAFPRCGHHRYKTIKTRSLNSSNPGGIRDSSAETQGTGLPCEVVMVGPALRVPRALPCYGESLGYLPWDPDDITASESRSFKCQVKCSFLFLPSERRNTVMSSHQSFYKKPPGEPNEAGQFIYSSCQ